MTEGAHRNTGRPPRRHLVLLDRRPTAASVRALRNIAGLRVGSDADVSGPITASYAFSGAAGYLLHTLGVAVVTAGPDQVKALMSARSADGPILAVEDERAVYALNSVEGSPGVVWGLQAVGAHRSTATGRGIGIAVLDSGIDDTHPDMADMDGLAHSFVPGEGPADPHGHGTHVAGIACGPREAGGAPGYGVAPDATVYVGRVLDADGTGHDGAVLSGIAWAVQNDCAATLIALGAQPRARWSRVFDTAAARATAKGTIVVAAAGNESRRAAGMVAPVAHPARCPSVLAVSALTHDGQIADYAAGTADAGQIDIAAPGSDIQSAWLGGYRTASGTSAAAAHVAGIAALFAERTGARGWDLRDRLTRAARRIPLPCTDVGAGLIQAPR